MEYLFWHHTSWTTPSDPVWGGPPQVVKLTSTRSVSHSVGHDRADRGTTSPPSHNLRGKCRSWASPTPSGISGFQNKLCHGLKTTTNFVFFAVKVVAVTLEMVRGRPVDSIARPTSLGRIQTVTMEGLNTYGTPWEPSEWTKTSTAGAIFGRFYGQFETIFRAFLAQRGVMWRVFLASRALE